mmetsp:Transcript_22634/g.27324  ORF Transcript_22634/g.27324 Transcript_22634/m.27324 type:complete len:256 (-) Transcript_22634:829-1596(-)|eukprot:CAMPEP_0197847034 /NCGR_PEP_ID=MMETSP1438-20131217/5046_1 /TAXON_ID=1461541 /ORGANISM="Pterosperma sp., Strain CCMP1384" /LENGTH=255 /DNA_ID=CAMNT_0043458841 /DNA_START=156 /DNA_END=923 /DNA_ORIENTATION=-
MRGAFGGYGGYGGFEQEAYRQSSLAGRNFSDFQKQQRATHFHASNVACLTGDDSVGPRQSQLDVFSRHGGAMNEKVTAGEATYQGIPRKPYHLLTGDRVDATGLGPHFGRFAKRIPDHQLSDAELKKQQVTQAQPPLPDHLGVGHSQRQYVDMKMALEPPGGGGISHYTADTAKEYGSYTELTTDKNKHARHLHNPQARADVPVTSAQAYGWNPTADMVKTTANHNKKCCRETRFVQSVMIGSRHKGGYSGQGTL